MRPYMTRALQVLAGAVFLWSTAATNAGCAVSPDGLTALAAAPLRADVRILPDLSTDPPMVCIFSGSGIGGAELHFAGGRVPSRLTLRLNLSGLEALTLNCDGRTVLASVLSRGNHAVQESLAGPDGEPHTPLDPGDESWAPVTPGYGEQAGDDDRRPLYFDVEIPAAFAKRGCASLRVDWIDFYR